MGKKIRVGLIGTGRAGMIHGRNMSFHIVDAQMVCVSDTDRNSAVTAAEELGCSYEIDPVELLRRPDIDAVIVAVPTKYHKDIVIEAANYGKNIFCEKPMGMNVEECQEMINAAERNNVILQIGFMRRFDKSFCRAKDIIESGQIGQVVMVKTLTHGPSTPHEWMYDIAKSNGPLAEVNSHDIDTLRWLTGGEVSSVYAVAGNYRCPQAKEKYPDFYDSVLMSVKMDNGMIGCIDGAQGVVYGYDARVDILGTKGLITVGDLKGTKTVTYTKETGMAGDVVSSWRDLFSEAYINEDKSFIDCVKNDKKPVVGGKDGLAAVAVVEAGNRSIKTGKVIQL